MVAKSGIAPNQKCNQITKEQRRRFTQELKGFKVMIKGFRPIDEAIITSGGVSVKEISPKTMESKLVKGLYFAEKSLMQMLIQADLIYKLHFLPGIWLQHAIAQAQWEI